MSSTTLGPPGCLESRNLDPNFCHGRGLNSGPLTWQTSAQLLDYCAPWYWHSSYRVRKPVYSVHQSHSSVLPSLFLFVSICLCLSVTICQSAKSKGAA